MHYTVGVPGAAAANDTSAPRPSDSIDAWPGISANVSEHARTEMPLTISMSGGPAGHGDRIESGAIILGPLKFILGGVGPGVCHRATTVASARCITRFWQWYYYYTVAGTLLPDLSQHDGTTSGQRSRMPSPGMPLWHRGRSRRVAQSGNESTLGPQTAGGRSQLVHPQPVSVGPCPGEQWDIRL